VLPWAGSYRGYDWNDRTAVLDPAPRFLPGEVLIDDRVFVEGQAIPPEDPLADDVADALAGEAPEAVLRELGVRWVVVEKGMPSGPVPGGETAYDGDQLTLVDLGEDVLAEPRRSGSAPLILTSHMMVAFLLLAGLFLLRYGRERDDVG
jgi:hypothetical protein